MRSLDEHFGKLRNRLQNPITTRQVRCVDALAFTQAMPNLKTLSINGYYINTDIIERIRANPHLGNLQNIEHTPPGF